MKKITVIIMMFVVIIINGCESDVKSPADQSKYISVKLVPLDAAQAVAEKFNPRIFFEEQNADNHSGALSKLTGSNQVIDHVVVNDRAGVPAFYIFNFANDAGYIFVSADYQISPVIGFVGNGKYSSKNEPEAFTMWKEQMFDNVETMRTGLVDNSKPAKASWNLYQTENITLNSTAALNVVVPPNVCASNPGYNTSHVATVGPLMAVTWGQACTYNDLCPDKSCPDCSTHALTGCVATATAQILKHWQKATPFNYNYAIMPNNIGNAEVQRLMRDLGTLLFMDYGCNSDGSGATMSMHNDVMHGFCGFSASTRANYNSAVVKSNIASHWPVILDGTRSGGEGHCWVTDGSQEKTYTFCSDGTLVSYTYLYFHMNWGWHEQGTTTTTDFSGWFAFDNWKPTPDRNYNSSQHMTTNIHP